MPSCGPLAISESGSSEATGGEATAGSSVTPVSSGSEATIDSWAAAVSAL